MANFTDANEMKYKSLLEKDATDAYYWCIEQLGRRSVAKGHGKWDVSFSNGVATFEFTTEADCFWFTMKWL